MSELLVEHPVTCPACWESHTVLIDLTDTQDNLIEDCTVCCNPMRICFEIHADRVVNVHAEALD